MAASVLLKSSKLIGSNYGPCVVLGWYPQRLHTSSVTDDVKPLPTTKLSSLKRGTGGRSSFSGVVATVFGGTGFFGTYVINKLGKQGAQMIIPYRGDSGTVRRLKLAGDLGQILFMPYHLNDEDALYKAMKHSNVVINLIGKDNSTPNFSFEDVHVTAARRLARIARQCGVERFVHLSSLNVAEKPKSQVIKGGSQFLASKWRGEQAVREEFPEAIIFRPADVYGQEDRFLRYYAEFWRRQLNRMPLMNKGVGIIKQPLHVSDMAKGIVNAIYEPNSEGKTYQAVGPRRYELSELMDYFYRVMRKTEEWGYKRTNMKYDPFFWIKVHVLERIARVSPKVCWDRVEREHVSDVVVPELPTLEDLGVTPTTLESRIKWELDSFQAYGYYEESLGEFPEPYPPPVYSG